MDDRPLTSGHVFIATSLDGFAARPDHGLDWLTDRDTGGDDLGYEIFVARMDGLVMGRGTYETVRGFGAWPYTKPVVVASASLTRGAVPEELSESVRISALDPPALMRSLAAEGWSRAYADGGRLVQSFLREGLIEDMVITTAPVLIGSGRRLFGELDRDVELELLGSRSFASGFVQSHYRVISDR